MFGKLLVANRGEIACRVMRTARRLGIRTAAVFSDSDAGALHVRVADEALRIGPAPARDSYLSIDAVVAAARACGADAVHPGYGFLSENATFAEACAAAGIAFVGPPAAAIRAMGDKAASKALMEKAGVPVVPGYHGAAQDDATLAAAAARIGYPVLVKASAGGGGRGMRLVREPGALAEALASARREAASAFGDDRLLVERYVERPRHVEVQVFADGHGGCIHLFERDCTLQRRHQKVVEEAPAPGMTAARRAAMGEAAVLAARAVGYAGAGTVEFVMGRDGSFFFMEMNTRLQVEHPVTELITGLDLVEWQLRVAAGECLPLRQDQVAISGHAFEARLYAEDPRRDFLPAAGRLARLDLPDPRPWLRVDAGLEAGDAVAVDYDPMIAKLVVHGPDRPAALRRLHEALSALRIGGATTNLDFLRRVARDPAFAEAGEELDTGFIARRRDLLVPPARAAGDRELAFAALSMLQAGAGAGPADPWSTRDGWRLNAPAARLLEFTGAGEARHVVHASPAAAAGTWTLALPGGEAEAACAPGGDARRMRILLAGRVLEASVTRTGSAIEVDDGEEVGRLAEAGGFDLGGPEEGGGGRFLAPMPGKLLAMRVCAGERVERGKVLAVLEAMKMEHSVLAPCAGVVGEVRFRSGDQVDEGAELLVFIPDRQESPET